jgi:hypothetical protein
VLIRRVLRFLRLTALVVNLLSGQEQDAFALHVAIPVHPLDPYIVVRHNDEIETRLDGSTGNILMAAMAIGIQRVRMKIADVFVIHVILGLGVSGFGARLAPKSAYYSRLRPASPGVTSRVPTCAQMPISCCRWTDLSGAR